MPEKQKNAAAVELGRRGGAKGGRARALSLTAERLREIASLGGRASRDPAFRLELLLDQVEDRKLKRLKPDTVLKSKIKAARLAIYRLKVKAQKKEKAELEEDIEAAHFLKP